MFLAFIFFFGSSMALAYFAWEEWHFREALIHEGVPTTAVITDCWTNLSGTSATSEFEVIQADGQIKLFDFEERFPPSSCKRGREINIRYLPSDPNQAGIEGVREVDLYITFSIVGFVAFLWRIFLAVSEYKKEQRQKAEE